MSVNQYGYQPSETSRAAGTPRPPTKPGPTETKSGPTCPVSQGDKPSCKCGRGEILDALATIDTRLAGLVDARLEDADEESSWRMATVDQYAALASEVAKLRTRVARLEAEVDHLKTSGIMRRPPNTIGCGTVPIPGAVGGQPLVVWSGWSGWMSSANSCGG